MQYPPKPDWRLVVLTALAVFGACQSALAADGGSIAAKGNGRGALACSSCHGDKGQGQEPSGFPRLAGLPAAYIVHALAGFADGSRRNAIMSPIAKALNEADRRAVALYYSKLPMIEPNPAPNFSAVRLSTGKSLADRGRWSVGLPACGQCHAHDGEGVGDIFPPLAGQGAVYIANQLNDWRAGKRRDDPMGLMAGVAKKLTPTEIADVADYYEALPSLTPKMQSRKGSRQ